MTEGEKTGNEARKEKAVDEVSCSGCGETIKKEAEICPKCGVRQNSLNSDLREAWESEYKTWLKRGSISARLAALETLLIWPIGYYRIGRGMRFWGLFILSIILDLVYSYLGFIVLFYATYEAYQTVKIYESIVDERK